MSAAPDCCVAACPSPVLAGAQFFMLFQPQPHLDGKHVVFGRLVGDMTALRAIEAVGSREGPTSEDVVMTSCSVQQLEHDHAAGNITLSSPGR